jgi:nucleoside-diphosphate-sugar epimerase
MTTLIVGCGYLGRRVGRLLSQGGEKVFGTTRSTAKAERLRYWGVEPVIADVVEEASLKTLPQAERVFVTVGFDRKSGVPIRDVYVDGLRRLMDALRPSRWVYASSTSVYGERDGAWVDECSPTDPRSESGRACLDAEHVIMKAPCPVVVLRYAGLYGPGRVVRRQAIERGEPVPGDSDRFLNLVHINDAARAAVVALDRGTRAGTYNVADERPVRRREYYGLVAECLGVGPPAFDGSPARDDANKRVRNQLMHAHLIQELTYPDIASGVPAALASPDLP